MDAEKTRILRVMLKLLLAMAEWQLVSNPQGGPTRTTYFGLRDAIDLARKEV